MTYQYAPTMHRFTNYLIVLFGLFFNSMPLYSQTKAIPKDSTKVTILTAVRVDGLSDRNAVLRLEPISGTYLFSGKKNEVILLNQMDGTVTDKTGRQLFAKVPGVFVYDMDGTGNQINIASRGLDPHRGWEFNIRKDGIITNSDMYGYPASHYSIPLEQIERIELVRGTGSLQYGAQFGGMLNYVSKKADTTKVFNFESFSTVGSYNLVSNYAAAHGTVGKFSYYAYVSKKSRDGYRQVEHTDYDAEGITLGYDPTKKVSLRLDWSRSNYVYHIPGPLTDAQFAADPKQATRTRNYFNPDIHIPSFTLKWKINAAAKLAFTSSAVLGKRNSVLFDKPATTLDAINPATMEYANRQVDIDAFGSFTNELRLLQSYRMGKHTSALTAGIQYMNNDLHRTQLGKGTTGSDFDLTLVEPTWGRDLHFKTQNIALFAENNFVVSNALSINVGARVETGTSKMSGTIVYYPSNEIPVTIKHSFPLLGSSFSYKPAKGMELYGGFSQVYRPMIFKDLVPASVYEKVDESIQDAKGYNAELGYRGNWKSIKWDVTGFLLQYNNRFGTVGLTDASGTFYTYRTNIGNSLTKGIELFVENKWQFTPKAELTLFTSTSFMNGRYTSGVIKTGTTNVSIAGNTIESVPAVLSRNGICFRYGKLSVSGLYSYTAKSYADALNTEVPSANGAVGLVPSYGLFDIHSTFKISSKLELKASLNNIFNKHYFTKRPLFYPGPGIWPSDGRTATLSFIYKLG